MTEGADAKVDFVKEAERDRRRKDEGRRRMDIRTSDEDCHVEGEGGRGMILVVVTREGCGQLVNRGW